MKELKGSRTEANLMAAYAGEAMAHTKYQFYAEKAAADGYKQFSNIFKETSHNEKEHAEIWFKLLHGESDMNAILMDAINGENYEWTEMYKDFHEVAIAEGFKDIAWHFASVGKIEHEHEERYAKILSNLENDTVFKKDIPILWICLNCGHEQTTTDAPMSCPTCGYPRSYFQEKCVNY